MAPFVRAGGLVRARYWPSESVVSMIEQVCKWQRSIIGLLLIFKVKLKYVNPVKLIIMTRIDVLT